MNSNQKQVTYTTNNSYETLNTLNQDTKNIWIVLHGIGYLSRYFIRNFDVLPPKDNYIIAPQAPSKYYLNNKYRRVGASWLTKENTNTEIENILNYLDQVYTQENITPNHNVIILGFSQGVSVASRWVGIRKIPCQHLVLYAGGIPKELTKEHFKHLIDRDAKISCIVGDKDEYINESARIEGEKTINSLFDTKAKQVVFDGTHEIKKDIILSLIE